MKRGPKPKPKPIPQEPIANVVVKRPRGRPRKKPLQDVAPKLKLEKLKPEKTSVQVKKKEHGGEPENILRPSKNIPYNTQPPCPNLALPYRPSKASHSDNSNASRPFLMPLGYKGEPLHQTSVAERISEVGIVYECFVAILLL